MGGHKNLSKQAERSTYCAYACHRATTVSSSLWSWTHKTSTKTLNAGGGGTWESRTTSKRRLVPLPTRKKIKIKRRDQKSQWPEREVYNIMMHACMHPPLSLGFWNFALSNAFFFMPSWFCKKIHSPQLWKTGPIFLVSLSKFGKQVEEEDKKVEEAGWESWRRWEGWFW